MTRKAKIIIGILTFLLLGSVALYFFVLRLERITYYNGSYDDYINEENTLEEEVGYKNTEEEIFIDPSCNVFGITLHGDLYTYGDEHSSEEIWYVLDTIEKDEDYKNIKAVILEIDSYGGIPVAGEEIANKLKTMEIPTIAVIRSAGVSAAYWAATGADRIFASRVSDVGGIGVTMSYLDESKLNEKEGYTWNTLSVGKFKDAGSDQKVLTEEEKLLFERDLKIIYEEFIKNVALNRNLSADHVKSLADGSTVLGSSALSLGLIDEIGYINEVENYIRNNYSFEPKICW